jgi:lysophospholipase L1-like esterase
VRDDVTDCVTVPDHRAVIAEHQPDAIVVLFGEFPNQAAEVDGRWTMPCEPSYLEPYGARLEAMLTDLASGGAPVLLLTAPGSDLAWVVDRVEPGMAERVACSNEQLRDLADRVPGVQIADLEALICPGGPCPDQLDGVDLRPDGLHFEGDGALLVNRWLVEQVREAVG